MADERCKCPSSFRYHALNCPTNPGKVRNHTVDKECNERTEYLLQLRSALQRRAERNSAREGTPQT